MDKNYKIYDYIFDPAQMSGIELIALVENPAIDILAVQLSKEIEVFEFKLASEEQRILVSPVLVPNQLIYRSDINGEPAYVRASKDTIGKLQEHFVTMGYQKNSNIEHEGKMIEGITFTEQWIVQDSANDTINAYGFKDVPVGAWCVKAKLSQGLWDDYVKTGKVKGFSVEGMLGLQLSENNNNNNEIKLKKMDKKTINQIILSAIKSVALASDLKEFVGEDGKSYYASALELDAIVTDVDGNLIVDVEFVFEGNTYKTDETGAIKEITPVEEVKEEEAPAEEVAVEEELADEVIVEEAPVDEAPTEEVEDVQALKDKIAEQEKIIADLEAKNIELEAKLVEQEDAVVEMSKQTPASSGIKTVSDVKFSGEESLTDMLKRLR